jgi:hypothetical protein
MPRLCVEFAGGNENSITSEVIKQAEQTLFEQLENLGQHAVNGVRCAAFQLERLN